MTKCNFNSVFQCSLFLFDWFSLNCIIFRIHVTGLIPFNSFCNLNITSNIPCRPFLIKFFKFLADLFIEWLIRIKLRMNLVFGLWRTHFGAALSARLLKLLFSNFVYYITMILIIHDLKLLNLLNFSLRWLSMSMKILCSFSIHYNLLWV